MIKAIETHFMGYKFRSRLEARWAVFFNEMGITYQYEPEGFELGGGLRYLPDFLLPHLDLWIEVKGDVPTLAEQEKVIRLTEQMPSRALALFYGDPSPDHMMFWAFGKNVPRFFFIECDRCGTLGYFALHEQAKGYLYLLRCKHKQSVIKKIMEQGFIPLASKVMPACIAARSARFEHGETPRGRPRR